MNRLILDSVVEITKQSDIDSLEYSFVAVLADLIPFKSISVFKYFDEGGVSFIEETVRLSIAQDESGGSRYCWSESPDVGANNKHIEQYFDSEEDVIVENDGELVNAFLPLRIGKNSTGAIGIVGLKGLEEASSLLRSFAKIYNNYLYILNESERDKLTNLFNRRTFEGKLKRLLKVTMDRQNQDEISACATEQRKIEPGSSAWLAILDIDHFKRVNDEYGHVCGDEVILLLAQKMQQCFRGTDLLFRFGGEEFVVVLGSVTPGAAKTKFERFRKAVEESKFPLVGSITISMGYTAISSSDYPQTVLENADKALYCAKENGRNLLYNYEELVETGVLEETKKTGCVDLF